MLNWDILKGAFLPVHIVVGTKGLQVRRVIGLQHITDVTIADLLLCCLSFCSVAMLKSITYGGGDQALIRNTDVKTYTCLVALNKDIDVAVRQNVCVHHQILDSILYPT